MEIRPVRLLPHRLRLFRLQLDDAVELMSVESALDTANGPLLRDQWLLIRLGTLAVSYPRTATTTGQQLQRIITGLDELANIAARSGGAGTALSLRALADIVRPHTQDPPG